MTCQWIPGDSAPGCDWSEECPVHGNGAPDARAILDTPMPGENDANAETVGDYLITLLATLWSEGEDFSGKRPFGNSNWEYDIHKALIMAGRTPGRLDGGGYIEETDSDAVNRLIASAIQSLRGNR